MKMSLIALLLALAIAPAAEAASGQRPAPPGSFDGAPPEYTRFSAAEIMRGFLALAFGSDLRIGAPPRGIRRFNHPIKAHVISAGSVDRDAAMRRIVEEYARKVPNLQLRLAGPGEAAEIEVRLIDEKDFRSALIAAFGADVATTFVERTDPQCMTSVKSDAGGAIVRSVSFVIVDQGAERWVLLDGPFADFDAAIVPLHNAAKRFRRQHRADPDAQQ